jgi:hypothetical protein
MLLVTPVLLILTLTELIVLVDVVGEDVIVPIEAGAIPIDKPTVAIARRASLVVVLYIGVKNE